MLYIYVVYSILLTHTVYIFLFIIDMTAISSKRRQFYTENY